MLTPATAGGTSPPPHLETASWPPAPARRSPMGAPIGTGDRAVLLQRCGSCGQVQYRYRALCSFCRSDALVDVGASDRGVVIAYSIVDGDRATTASGPHVVALVELDGEIRVSGDVIGGDSDHVGVGTEVELASRGGADGHAVPAFRVIVR